MPNDISLVSIPPQNRGRLIGNITGSLGNENIRSHHIKFFEKELLRHNENQENTVVSAPNYYAWLCIITEHLFWKMRSFCFSQNEFNQPSYILLYNELITQFIDTCRKLDCYSESELKTLFEIAIKLLEIRHAITHKGFPNLLPESFENKAVKNRKKPAFSQDETQEKFTEASTRKTIDWFKNPQNFAAIKEQFKFLTKALNSGTGFSVTF